jgi:O-antigen ligase
VFHKLKKSRLDSSTRLDGVSNLEALTWRVGFALSFLVTIVRLSQPEGILPDVLWSLGQFLPLLLSGASAVFLAGRFRFGIVQWVLTGAAAFVLLSVLWSRAPGVSFQQGAVLLFVFAFLVATTSTRWLDRSALRGDFVFFFWLVCAAMVLGGAIWVFAPQEVMGYFDRYQGVFPNPNYTALLASVTIPIGVWLFATDGRKPTRVLVFFGLLSLVLSLYFTGSRGALVGALAGVVVALLLSKYRRFALWGIGVAISLLVALMLVVPEKFFGRGGYLDRSDQGSDFTSGRWDIWVALVRVWQDHPVLGIGYRTVELLPSSDGFTAHNIYLSILVELGVVGLLIFLAVFAILLVVGLRGAGRIDRALAGAVVAVLVGELTESSVFGFGGPTAILSWSIIVGFAAFGALDVADRRERAESQPRNLATSHVPAESADDNSALEVAEGAIRASVCMATYNGSAYVAEQVDSILAQLAPDDELVIVDDASRDDTLEVLRTYVDPRVRIIPLSTNVGHVRAFERAVVEATGEYLLFSDQDDIWVEGRLEQMVSAMQTSTIVASNWRHIGGAPNTWAQFTDQPATARSNFSNLAAIYRGRLPYFGCAMGMRRDALPLVLPFPRVTEAHDVWIAIAGSVDGGMAHMSSATVERRIHANNLTPKTRRSLRKKLKTRLGMIELTLTAWARDARRTLRSGISAS